MASLLLICAVLCPAFVQGNDYCDSAIFNNQQYSTLFSKLEESLLDHVRHIFMNTESVEIDFSVQLQLNVNGSNLPSCQPYYYSNVTFCSSNSMQSVWELCHIPDQYKNTLGMTYSSQTLNKLQWESERQKVDGIIVYISPLHGSLLAAFSPFLWSGYDSEYGTGGYSDGSVSMNLRLERLDCNPPITLTKCTVSELLSWVSKIYKCGKHAQQCIIKAYMCSQIKVYSESGGKLQTHWDQSQKGTVTDYDYYDDRQGVFKWPMNYLTLVKLSLAEYVVVSLCLALVIAILFPAVHNHIISKATRFEHQSLYWGMVVVSNTFVYGLVFAAAKGWSIIYSSFLSDIISNNQTIIVSVLLEVVINVILFSGALFASLKSRNSSHGVVPRELGKFLINLSFCWSCFCVCVCCSKRCRAKTMSVLIMFSLMVFLHHNIMDAISFGFALFIEPTRIIVITIGLLYISFMVFFVLSISLLIFILRGRNTRTPLYQQFISLVGIGTLLLIIFGAVGLMIVLYMIIFFSLRLHHFSGIVTGLIPSIALSAASWYIKKRLERGLSQPNTDTTQPEYGATAGTVNDGENNDSDEQRMLLP